VPKKKGRSPRTEKKKKESSSRANAAFFSKGQLSMIRFLSVEAKGKDIPGDKKEKGSREQQ